MKDVLHSPYHVEPDDPVMYEIASKRPSFWRPNKLPNKDVSARVPPPVVMTATIGTCLNIDMAAVNNFVYQHMWSEMS